MRAGHRVNHVIYRAAYRVRKIAAYAGLPEQDLARLDDILASVKREHPAEPGLTPKNRRLLEHVDDPAFVDRLLAFPQRLMEAAKTASCERYGASYARDAVAVELLLTCSMRVGNPASLRVGETIRKFGEGRDARWIVDLPAETVKNRQPLRYVLLPESGRLIEWYLANWHPYWCGADAPWLFPVKGGGHIDPAVLTTMIQSRALTHVGVEISCHQFRHIAAELYLKEDPVGLGVVSPHLGPRKFDTTRAYYAREQTRVATQRYHDVLARKRYAGDVATAQEAQADGEGQMTKLLCLPVEQWPEVNRARWSAAKEPAGFLEGDKPASHWSAAPSARQPTGASYRSSSATRPSTHSAPRVIGRPRRACVTSWPSCRTAWRR